MTCACFSLVKQCHTWLPRKQLQIFSCSTGNRGGFHSSLFFSLPRRGKRKKNNSQWIWVPCLSNQGAQTERWVHSLFPASALVFDEFLRRRWERRMSFNPAWFPDWITLGMQACLSVCLDDWLVWRSARVLYWWPNWPSWWKDFYSCRQGYIWRHLSHKALILASYNIQNYHANSST